MNLLAFSVALGISLASASANLVQNGGFEDNTANPFGGNLYEGQTTLADWEVFGLQPGWSVDLHNSYWKSYDENGVLDEDGWCIDLDGNVGHMGGIKQSVGTVAGQQYTFSFKLGGNYYAYPTEAKTAEVYWRGVSLGTFTHVMQPGDTPLDYTWQTVSLTVTGSGGLDELRFESRTPSGWGAAIDEVSVEAVPEPATLAALGLGAAALLRRLRRS